MTKETYIKELNKILKRAHAEVTIEELEKIKTEIKEYCENYGIYDWGIIHIVEKHIKELKGEQVMEGKSYLQIMKEALKSTIVDKEKKPDLSMKDWKFVLECLVTLNNISKRIDDINPERFKDNCELEFEVLEDITGYKIISEVEK